MLTLMLGTVILALTYGALWHNQPARRRNDKDGEPPSPLGTLLNRSLEWLLQICHLSHPGKKQKPVVISERSPVSKRQAMRFLPMVGAFLMLNPLRRLLVGRAAVRPPLRADSLK